MRLQSVSEQSTKAEIRSYIRELTREANLAHTFNEVSDSWYMSHEVESQAYDFVSQRYGTKKYSNALKIGNLDKATSKVDLLMRAKDLEAYLDISYDMQDNEIIDSKSYKAYETIRNNYTEFAETSYAEYLSIMNLISFLDKDVFKGLYGAESRDTSFFSIIKKYRGKNGLTDKSLLDLITEGYYKAVAVGSNNQRQISRIVSAHILGSISTVKLNKEASKLFRGGEMPVDENEDVFVEPDVYWK